MTSSALTTPSVWDVSYIDGAGLESAEDLFIVLKSVFPQGNVEITKKDEITFRVKLPYCSKIASLMAKFGDYGDAITIISAGADLSVEQTRRLAAVKANILKRRRIDENAVEVKIIKVPGHSVFEDLVTIPKYHSDGRSGLDLHAYLPGPLNRLRLYPNSYTLVPTGIAVAIPKGYEGQIRPRTDLAFLYGITVMNSPGTIDSDFRGQIMVLLINFSNKMYEIVDNEKIAQLVVSKVNEVRWCVKKTKRVKGWDSTGSDGGSDFPEVNWDSEPQIDSIPDPESDLDEVVVID
ncbi:deoxyuridine 5'-triphosphate nucleotidohydrolase-like [Macrosteles quadrilineatus]|uniref:deoxyuridine 5'-triphosphate nucleotidohydrolase-like n=1 Tax=Macrosteles quadrilineatus TaxID=74068 RepID=UPI0023E10063|nr:deoxyuridine 5'-triphosphate nucleotidohydrolase-like [Macrosteles quadrilineatus]